MNTVREDMRFERCVTDFLVDNMTQFEEGTAVPVFYEDNPALQLAGVDISCQCGMMIDVKVKNRDRIGDDYAEPYPSLELTLHDGQVLGWFAKPGMATTHYMFVDVLSRNPDWKTMTSDDIEQVSCLIVPKTSLVDHVEYSEGLDALLRDADILDRSYPRIYYKDKDGNRLFHITYSWGKPEHPVNLVYRREDLQALPGARFAVVKRKNNG